MPWDKRLAQKVCSAVSLELKIFIQTLVERLVVEGLLIVGHHSFVRKTPTELSLQILLPAKFGL